MEIRRNQFFTAMQILACLRDGPMSPSRIAQACNVNYGRLNDQLKPLEEDGWISKQASENQLKYSITSEGLDAFHQWESLWSRFQKGLGT